MLKVLISGCNGRMGKVVAEICREAEDVEIAAGFDLLGQKNEDYPIFSSPAEYSGPGDALIDFSSPGALPSLLEFGLTKHIPLVLATTGYSQEQLEQIEAASRDIPIFRSGNMSLGVNVLVGLVKKASAALGGDFDIEIVERYHNRKVDAPSGTMRRLRLFPMDPDIPMNAKASAAPEKRERSAYPPSGAETLWETMRSFLQAGTRLLN